MQRESELDNRFRWEGKMRRLSLAFAVLRQEKMPSLIARSFSDSFDQSFKVKFSRSGFPIYGCEYPALRTNHKYKFRVCDTAISQEGYVVDSRQVNSGRMHVLR
jgi:hypothetical protein